MVDRVLSISKCREFQQSSFFQWNSFVTAGWNDCRTAGVEGSQRQDGGVFARSVNSKTAEMSETLATFEVIGTKRPTTTSVLQSICPRTQTSIQYGNESLASKAATAQGRAGAAGRHGPSLVSAIHF